jgi:flagellar motility protein MotE (MotC chaperone)
MKKAVEEVCDCDRAGISTNYNNGVSSVTLTLEGAETGNREELADRVFANLKKKYPKICDKDEVIINFEDGSFTRGFIYTGCGDDVSPFEDEIDEEDIEEEIEELEEEMKEAEEEFEEKMKELEEKLDEIGK